MRAIKFHIGVNPCNRLPGVGQQALYSQIYHVFFVPKRGFSPQLQMVFIVRGRDCK